VLNRWAGPLVTSLILLGVGLIVLFNLNPTPPTNGGEKPAPNPVPSNPSPAPGAGGARPLGGMESPIGDEVLKNHMRIAAVELPAIAMDGMPAGSDIIHVEADIHATENNPNGFALDEFVPYLKIAYKIVPAAGGAPIHHGDMLPMIAADGLHYGASVAMPKAGQYRLIYDIQPPSAGGLGRHSDPATGVAPWWEPFQVTFDWDYQGPPKPSGPVKK
jgi:uncharacterized protein involved in high-affinity Fe2+ transport